jgi:tetratricopeptide (TPR) repeat protein
MRHRTLALIAAALLLAAAPALAQDPLAEAKDLYASAEYEKALGALDEARKAPGLAPPVLLAIEQYRALCLLAVGQKGEAERAIEAVLDLDPFYTPGEDDAAPWVRQAFREVRRRVLPATLQQRYGRGKQAFERKEYVAADAAFGQVLRILDDPDLSLDQGATSDMRLVVHAFLDLSKAAREQPPPAPVPGLAAAPAPPSPQASPKPESPPPATPAPAATTGNPASSPPAAGGIVYDSTASTVLPPLPLRQSVTIPEQARPLEEIEGVVEIVIGRSGTIESATVRQSFGAALDGLVLQSVKAWRYRPGILNGSPVRYRRLVRIVLPSR